MRNKTGGYDEVTCKGKWSSSFLPMLKNLVHTNKLYAFHKIIEHKQAIKIGTTNIKVQRNPRIKIGIIWSAFDQ